MGGTSYSTFPGIYSCPFDEFTGRCVTNATTLVDTVLIGETRERGPLLSNVRLNPRQDKVLALRTEALWEILWAPLNASETSSSMNNTSSWSAVDGSSEPTTLSLSAYLRVPKVIYTDQSKGQDCANYNGSRFAYYEVLPMAFAVDENDDVFISWEGYFQDCQDANESGNGLVWSIGVNKVVNKSCLLSDKIQTFDDCTLPHSIFYRGLVGKDRRLGDGMEMSLSPANRHLFFLSVVNRAYGVNNANELWVAPEGIHKKPIVVPTPQMPNSTGYQATRIIPDIASIRLRLDANQHPRAVCQTAYNKGVFCYGFDVADDGTNLQVTSNHKEPIFVVTEEQVAESCTIDTSILGGEEYMSGLATGVEVVWGEDNSPDVVLFGCYGGLPDRGNMTAVLRDGSVTQVLEGAFPGSVLFGIDVAMNNGPNSVADNDLSDVSPCNDQRQQRNVGLIISVVGASIALVVAILLIHSRTKKKVSRAECVKTNIPPVEISLAMTCITSKIDEEASESGRDVLGNIEETFVTSNVNEP